VLSREEERLLWPLAKTASTLFFSAAILPSVVRSGMNLRREKVLESVAALLARAGILFEVVRIFVCEEKVWIEMFLESLLK
jgi:hypothetical protein